MDIQVWDSPDPRGPKSPFPGKEGFGVQKPPFPLVKQKGVFCQKVPFFFKGLQGKWGFLDRSLCVRAKGMGFLGPKTLFSRKWGFGPCLGSGESQIQVSFLQSSLLSWELSGPLNRLNAILSLHQPLDRYRTPSAIGSAIGTMEPAILNCFLDRD